MSTVHKVMQLWRPGQYIKPHDAGPRIAHLFGAGEQGGVYLFDKAHQASAFQGGAYDTPLSAVEQFIGSFYDLSGNANHYSQTTSTARGKWSARVNRLIASENLLDAAWATNVGATKLDAHTIQFSAANAQVYQYASVPMHAGATVRFEVELSGSGTAALVIGFFGGTYEDGVKLITLTSTPTVFFIEKTAAYSGHTSCAIGVSRYTGTAAQVTIDKADARAKEQFYLPYQRVNTAADYDTAGFPPYLLADGADDYYTSASGGGSTTGIFICAAIAPWAAGAKQVIWSDASGNTGYELCINASNQVEFSAGTGSDRVPCVSAALALGAPKVITAQHDGTNLTVRVDGVATTAACGAASAGTAGATLLRANGAASGYAKVQINGLVQRHGAQPSAELLTFAERYMATLQGRAL